MKINIITLFPDFFKSALEASLLGKAIAKGILTVNFIDLRTFGEGKHQLVDDTPYSGGPGLIMRVDIAKSALDSVSGHKIVMSASGKLADQAYIDSLASHEELTILCPRYEGFDERILNYVDDEVSTGNFVLSGGEIPALAIIDGVARLLPGFMHTIESTHNESFRLSDNGKPLVEYPQFTKPEHFEDNDVPAILLSGNHGEIDKWKLEQSIEKTKKNRPDLLN